MREGAESGRGSRLSHIDPDPSATPRVGSESLPSAVYAPRAPYVPSMPKKRSGKITAAALLAFVVGAIGLIAGIALIVLDLIGGNLKPGSGELLENMVAIAMAAGLATALVILVGAVMNGFAWYWLWGNSMSGGYVGAICGFNDIIFPAIGILWMEYYLLPSIGLSLGDVPWLYQGLFAIMVIGIVMIALLALGWKNLEG